MIRKLIGRILGKGDQAKPAAKAGDSARQDGEDRRRGPSSGTPSGESGEQGSSGSGQRRRRRRRGGRQSDGSSAPRDGSAPRSVQSDDRPPRAEHARDGDSADRPKRNRRRSGSGKGNSRDGYRDREPRQESRRGPEGRDDRREPAEAAERAARESRKVAVRPEVPVEVPAVSEDNEFIDLGLEAPLAAAVEEKGYIQPTPIQSEAIPLVLAGRDVVGSAQTGTGKTAAFALPILQHLKTHGELRCLVLGPTRELAQQVGEAFQIYGKFTNIRSTIVYGGVGYGPQREDFDRGIDVVVATPGRLLDHLGQGSLSLSKIQYLVLDEVDRMLDMGFLPDVKRIIALCPKERQTLFFSATIPPELEKFTEWCLNNPHTIEIGRRRAPAETVAHAFYPITEHQKFDLLLELLERTHYESVLIFTRTKHGADFVASRLEANKHKVTVMHSNRSQRERGEALAGFKSGKYEVMVATDVAARGLDIQGISHVINYDTPQHPEDYVHRIGRTGRAHNEGDAFTLLTEEELKYAASIERFIGQKVERKRIDDFPYKYSAVFASMEGEPKNVFRSRLYRGTRG